LKLAMRKIITSTTITPIFEFKKLTKKWLKVLRMHQTAPRKPEYLNSKNTSRIHQKPPNWV